MKSENASTDITIFEYNLFLLHLPWIPRPKEKKIKGSKKQFQKQIITNETFWIHTKKQPLDKGGFYFNLFFQNLYGEAILQDTVRGLYYF